MRPAGSLARLTACAAASLAVTGVAAQSDAVPRFPLADHGPFSGLLGIPDGWTDTTGAAADVSWTIVNNAVGQQSGAESMLLDGETSIVTLRARGMVGTRLAVGVELPWLAHSGGFLDPAIDRWHDWFGLSDGIRPYLPTDALSYRYTRDPAAGEYDLEQHASGLGDLHTAAAMRLGGTGQREDGLLLELTADVDWPTGDAAKLTGGDSTDIAAGLSAAAPLTGPARWGWSARAGVVWPGDLDAPLPVPRARFFYYDAALAWRALQTLDVILQAQGHSAAFRSDLKMLGSHTLQLGGGVIWRFAGAFGLRAGVFEDIRTDTMPDVTLELALTYRPGR